MLLLAEAAPMRPAALVLLALFAGACLMLLPRELAFIRGAGGRWRARFLIQDALIILSILAVLLPCSLVNKLTETMLITVLAGFTLLWITVIWAAASRYGYVRHLLQAARDESALRLAQSARSSAEAPRDAAAGGKEE